jgi:hypothetical protein
MNTNLPKTTPKVRKSAAPKSLKKVDLERANKQVLTILGRQIDQLMEASYKELLDKDQLANLSVCHKLLSEFRRQEEEDLATLSDEELEKLT